MIPHKRLCADADFQSKASRATTSSGIAFRFRSGSGWVLVYGLEVRMERRDRFVEVVAGLTDDDVEAIISMFARAVTPETRRNPPSAAAPHRPARHTSQPQAPADLPQPEPHQTE